MSLLNEYDQIYLLRMSGEKSIWLDIMLLGGSGNGKTYFLRRYMDKQQDPKTLPTIAVDFRRISIDVGERQQCKGFLWDSSGIERFDNITQTYIKNKLYFIIFADVTNQYELHTLERFVKLIENNCQHIKRAKVLILGNKIDLISRESNDVVHKIRRKYLYRHNFMVQFVSFKNDFQQAKGVVENFIRKCYEEEYRFKMLPTIRQFFDEFPTSDSQWYNNHAEREKVRKNCQEELKKKKNGDLVKILSLALEICTKFNHFFNDQRKQLNYIKNQFNRLIQEQGSALVKEIQQIKAKCQATQIFQQLTKKDVEMKQQERLDKYQKEMQKLEEKLMEYEYWIVEADRLHYSVSEAIANSPVRGKFAEFRRVAQEVNSLLEEEMGSWEVHSNQPNTGDSFIQSGINTPSEFGRRMRLQKRLNLEQKLQMLEQIIEELVPTI